ncbi:FlgO family outer membrane protein [Hydrogenobaculum sp.]
MQYKKLINFLPIVVFSLSQLSCSSITSTVNYEAYKLGIEKSKAPLKYLADRMAYHTCPTFEVYNKTYTIPVVAVMTYVDSNNINYTSALGKTLTELFKDALIRECKVRIIEINLSKYVTVNSHGDMALSSDVKDLRTKFKTSYIYQGMYTLTRHQLIVYTRLINVRTGNIDKAYTDEIPANDEIRELHDE